MRTVVTEVYTFSELSKEGQENALEWARNVDFDWYGWHDDNVQSLKEFAEWLGAKFDYDVSLLGGWAKIILPQHAVNYNQDDEIDSWFHELAGDDLLQWLEGESSVLDKDCPFTGYCMDEDLLDPFRDYLKNPDDSTLQELATAGVENWLRAYIADWEYTYSDEALSETLEANEYEFTKNGKWF